MLPQWIENHGVHSLTLGSGAMKIVVAWDILTSRGQKGGYKVSIERIILKKRFDDLDSAKMAGLNLAEKLIKDMLEEVNKESKKYDALKVSQKEI